MPIQNGKTEVVEYILSNPKVQSMVVGGSGLIAVDSSIMKILPEYITVIGGTLGIVLSALMITHKVIQIRNDLKA